MKPSILRVLLFALTASPGITPAAETNPPGDIAASVANAIDWPAFMARQDMHFNRAPTDWTQAPHFGNASISSMLCQAGRVVRLQIFRADVQDPRDCDQAYNSRSPWHLSEEGQVRITLPQMTASTPEQKQHP